jgi:hypothetical protein
VLGGEQKLRLPGRKNAFKVANRLLVEALGGFEDIEIDADSSGQMHEDLKIFREAEAAEAQTGAEELPPTSAPIFSQRSAMTLA